MLTIKTQVRKTKTVTGIALVALAGVAIGSVTSGETFGALTNEGVDLGSFGTRARAMQAVWRASEGKEKSGRGGDQRSGGSFVTRTEAAVALGISKSTLARRIKSGAVVETAKGVKVS